ncbi:MAG: cupin domain-containing protein, partial [Acidimicrobiia bacterium]
PPPHNSDSIEPEPVHAGQLAGSNSEVNGLIHERSGQKLTAHVLRAGNRKRVVYPGSGIANELLTPDLRCTMEVIWVEAPKGAGSGGHPHEHDGEECGIVLQGTMRFWAGEQEYLLGKQDSIYLSSRLPHRWTNPGDETLVAVWIISPPTF